MKTRISTPWPLTGGLSRLAKIVFQRLWLVSALSVVPLPAAEVSNYALDFDGDDDRVQAATDLFSDVINNFTIELWANPTGWRMPTAEANTGISDIANQRYAVFPDHGHQSYGEGHAGAGLSIGSNGVSVVEHGFGHLPSVLVYSIDISGWTHVALVYSNRQPHLYVNGLWVRTGLAGDKPYVHPSASLGGSLGGIGYGNYQGQLDEVRIWNTPLSQAQIQANMNHSLTGDEPNLVVYFRCDEGTGLTLTDHAPAGPTVNGTLTNGTSWLPSPVFVSIGAGLPGTYRGSAGWGDYDNDGRLDILLTGLGLGGGSPIWRNTGSGFANLPSALPIVTGDTRHGTMAWGDYDNDGQLDVLLAGTHNNEGGNAISQVWRNNGSGVFTDIQAGLPGVVSSSVAWGDYNNDGRLDIALAGYSFIAPPLWEVWRNTGDAFSRIDSGLRGFSDGSMKWGDYDNDGRLDLLGVGLFNYASYGASVWRNNGGAFSNTSVTLPNLTDGSVAWGDYDNDGRLDFLLTGFDGTTGLSQLWRNTGSTFTNVPVAGLPGVYFSAVAWGDYDNDGRLDFLVTGTNGAAGCIAQIWRNTGTGFTNIQAGLRGVRFSSVAWGDYDNDGRLDFLLVGQTTSGERISQIWRNNTPVTNTPPNAPTGLAATVTGSSVTFSWNAASDAQTPTSGLTYNLRVGTTPGGGDIVGPMATNSGFRRVPEMGNAQRKLSRSITGIPLSKPIYWSVQAVDTAFAGSAFAAEKTFTINIVLTPPNGIAVSGDVDGDGVVSQAELNGVLSNYFPTSPFLQMTNVAGLGGTNVTFALTNDLAGAFSVEYTTNFLNWHLLGPATPRYLFTDTNAPAVPQRYYRLRWP